jgi:hypothetical protein
MNSENKPAPYSWDDGFDVKPAPIGRTKHWKKVELIFFQDGRLLATACSESTHQWVRSDMVQIKFENDFLYQVNLIPEVEAFLEINKLELISISRVDIALDFTGFFSEQMVGRYSNPEKLIQDYNRDKILHVGRCSFAVDGATLFKHFIEFEDIEKARHKFTSLMLRLNKGMIQSGTYKVRGVVTSRKENNYLRFGTMNSDVAAYMYNKTKQLELVNKPWIKDNWFANGYDGKKDVWRLEVSFKGAVKELAFVDADLSHKMKMKVAQKKEWPEGMKTIPYRYNFKTLDILKPVVLPDLFYCAVDKYFSFCKNENLRNKGRFKRLKLFDYKLPSAVIIDKTDKLQSNRMDKIFVHRLDDLKKELRMLDETEKDLRGTAGIIDELNYSPDSISEMVSEVKKYFVGRRGMNDKNSDFKTSAA